MDEQARKAKNYEYALDVIRRGGEIMLVLCDDATASADHPPCGSAAFNVSALFVDNGGDAPLTGNYEITHEDAERLAPMREVHDQRTVYHMYYDGQRKGRLRIELRPPGSAIGVGVTPRSAIKPSTSWVASVVWHPDEEGPAVNGIEVTYEQVEALRAIGAKEAGDE
jgi:hypothetical protein